MRGRFAALLWLSALSGCNLVFGLDAPDDSVDAGDDGGGGDAALGRFDDPRPVTQTVNITENDAIMTADETEAIWAIATSTEPLEIVRTDVSGGEWGPPTLIEELSVSLITDGFLRFGRDDTTLYFSSDRPGGPGGLDVYASTRGDRAAPWNQPMLVVSLSGPTNDQTAAPCASNSRFVIASNRDGTQQLYEYDTLDGRLPNPIALTLETPRSPFLTEDCLTLYVAGGVSVDLYVLRRDAIGSPWSNPEPLSELNTTDGNESDPWLSPSGRHILFSRDGDIWEAFR